MTDTQEEQGRPPVDWALISDLLTLLDLIEAKEDWKLAGGRLDIMMKHGYTPIFGNPLSAVLH